VPFPLAGALVRGGVEDPEDVLVVALADGLGDGGGAAAGVAGQPRQGGSQDIAAHLLPGPLAGRRGRLLRGAGHRHARTPPAAQHQVAVRSQPDAGQVPPLAGWPAVNTASSGSQQFLQ
jgi:hypothetical protein